VNQPEPSTSVGKEVIVMNKLVRLWKRPSRDGKRFSYVLIYRDEQGVLVQRELDKSVSPLKEYLAFGKEVFLGMRKLRMVFAAGKRGWQEFNCHPPRSFVAFG